MPAKRFGFSGDDQENKNNVGVSVLLIS